MAQHLATLVKPSLRAFAKLEKVISRAIEINSCHDRWFNEEAFQNIDPCGLKALATCNMIFVQLLANASSTFEEQPGNQEKNQLSPQPTHCLHPGSLGWPNQSQNEGQL